MTMQRRDFTLSEIKVSQSSDDAGVFSGYGAVFGNVDSYGDIIKAGAFAASLKEWGAKGKLPPMLLQHGGGFFGGGADDMLPVGKWLSMEENSRGLKVQGQLFAMNTERGQYIYEGLKSGVLDGLSIGFMTRNSEEEIVDGERYRILTDIDLWELSIVTFPANPKARVSAVKAAEHINTIRDFEGFLRDVGGFSNARAKAIATHGFKASEPREEDVPGMDHETVELLKSLHRLTDTTGAMIFGH